MAAGTEPAQSLMSVLLNLRVSLMILRVIPAQMKEERAVIREEAKVALILNTAQKVQKPKRRNKIK